MIDVLAKIFTYPFWVALLAATVPYAMAALGGSTSERSGVINIALEGKLVTGAFCASVGAFYGGSVYVGVLAGIAGGAAVAALYALIVIRFRADQIVAGVAINMMAYGLTRFLLKISFPDLKSTQNSPDHASFGHGVFANPVFWLAVVCVVGVTIMITRTPFGLRVRAVGDHPEAADTLGVSVNRIRWMAVLLAGMLAGLGGAWLSLDLGKFVAEMSGGRGYIALAAVIMGRWRPLAAVAACLMFGFAETLMVEMKNADVGVPNELVEMFPYLLTMVTLAGFLGAARAPRALGKPYR